MAHTNKTTKCHVPKVALRYIVLLVWASNHSLELKSIFIMIINNNNNVGHVDSNPCHIFSLKLVLATLIVVSIKLTLYILLLIKLIFILFYCFLCKVLVISLKENRGEDPRSWTHVTSMLIFHLHQDPF